MSEKFANQAWIERFTYRFRHSPASVKYDKSIGLVARRAAGVLTGESPESAFAGPLESRLAWKRRNHGTLDRRATDRT